MIDTLNKIRELIEQNKRLEQRNEELKNIVEINLKQKKTEKYLPIQEIIGKTEIESLVFKFYQKHKIPAAIFLKENGPLFSIGWKRLNNQNYSGMCCNEFERYLHQNDNTNRYFHYKCLHSFNAITFPIIIRKKHVATLVFNQFFFQNEVPGIKSFEDFATKNSLSENELLNLFTEIPVFSNAEIEIIINQGIILADMISFIGSKNFEFYEKFKFQINNELILHALKDKISEQETIIKSLTSCISAHFNDIKNNMINKDSITKELEKLNNKCEITEKLLNTVLTSIPLSIIFIKNDVITYANDQIFRLTGYTTKEIIGRNPLYILPEYGLWNKLKQLSSNEFIFKEHSTFKTTIRSKSKGIQNVICFISPLDLNKPSDAYIMSFIDMFQINKPEITDNNIIHTSNNTASQTSYDWSNKTILIAEDEELNYFYIQKILSPTKVKIKWAENGQKAIDFFNQDPDINLVLMDIKMPVLNGIEATKIIKSKNKQIPVIAQTAYAHEINKEAIIKAGCDEFIPKPLNSDQFFTVLEKFLS